MSLSDFHTAVIAAANKYAPQYGLSPDELRVAMLTAAGLEGGLGETAGVGDGGASVGRFQYNMAGGHGSTLLNQGYTAQQIADDAFQANDWAPIMAANLAAVKKAGASGASAIQQAVFNAERPAAMYPTDRFTQAFSTAVNMAGTPKAPQTGLGGPGATDPTPTAPALTPDMQKLHDQFMAAVKTSITKYNQTNDPKDFMAVQNALGTLSDFEASFGGGQDYLDKTAQAKFDNAIKLGDYTQSQATADFNKWTTKSNLADSAAKAQLADATQKNSDNASVYAAWLKRGELGLPGDQTYYKAPTFEDSLAHWQDKLGVGAEPGAAGTYSGPALPQFGAGDAAAVQGEPGAVFRNTPPATGIDTSSDPTGNVARTPGNPFGYKPTTPSAFWGADPNAPAPADTGSGTDWGGVARNALDTLPGGPVVDVVAKNAKKWWNTLGSGLLHHAGGTANSPGGQAMLGEKGPETMIDPQTGQPVVVGANGPEVRNISPGTAVIPNGVPPNEAFIWSQIQKASQQGPQPGQAGVDQQGRANDPQLREKVLAALQKAIAARDAAHPPPTPTLPDGGEDLWANWRPLTGVGADGTQYAIPQQGGGR